jgi:hypothetical protein
MLEMALIRLTEVQSLPGVQTILDHLAALETRLGGGAAAPPPAALPLFDRPAAETPRPAPPPARPWAARPGPERQDGMPSIDAASGWQATVLRLKGRKRVASVLTDVRPLAVEDDRLLLEVGNDNAFVRDTLEDPETRKLLGETASAAFGSRLRVEYRFVAATQPSPAGLAAEGAAEGPRPQDHPIVREALSLFGGTVIRQPAG